MALLLYVHVFCNFLLIIILTEATVASVSIMIKRKLQNTCTYNKRAMMAEKCHHTETILKTAHSHIDWFSPLIATAYRDW